MLDIKLIRENPDDVVARLAAKGNGSSFDDGMPAVATDSEVEKHYREVARKIIDDCAKHC